MVAFLSNYGIRKATIIFMFGNIGLFGTFVTLNWKLCLPN